MQKFPSLLVLGLALLVIAVLQISAIVIQLSKAASFNSPAAYQTIRTSATAPVENLGGISKSVAGRVIDWPVQPHNARLGNSLASNQLIIATDTCRPAVRKVLTQIASRLNNLDVVIKYVPTEPAATDSGMLWQLAERADLFQEYWQLVCQRQAEGYELTLAQQVGLLEDAGMSLTEQRTQMSMHLSEILSEINADNDKAQILGLQNLPIFILNGKQVMPQGL